MTSPSSPNPLIAQFRAAGRLINEWRDTLFYGALGAVTAAGVASPDVALGVAALREYARYVGWRANNTPVLVGTLKQPPSADQMALAAGAMTVFAAGGMVFGSDMSLASSSGVLLATTSVGTFMTVTAGGPKAVWAAYRDVMWDYPRKKDDGGTPQTQTQRLKDGSNEMVQQLVDQMTPPGTAPTPVPIRARSNSHFPRPRR